MRLSLLTKLGLALGAVGLVPLAAVSWQLIDMNRAALTEQVLQVHSVSARTVAGRVEGFLSARTTVAQAIGANAQLTADPASPEAAAALRGALEAQPELAAIALVSKAREPIVRAQRRDLNPGITAAMAAATPASPQATQVGGDLWIAITIDAPSIDAFIETAWRASSLNDLIQPEEIGEDAAIELATTDGHVITGTLPSLDSLPPSLVSVAKAGRISGAGRFPAADGSIVLGAYAPIASTPWFVVSSQPAAVAESVARRMRQQATIAIGATVLVAVLMLGVAYRSTVRPIRELLRDAQAAAAAQVEAGDSTAVEAAPAYGDEVAQLKAAFAVLERRAAGRETANDSTVYLGRYQVLDTLGQGGSGMVFRGWDPKLKRSVAIKTFRAEAGLSEAERAVLVQALLDEAVKLAAFAHPNIVAVYDAANTTDLAYVAMELVDGVSLELYADYRGRMAADEVIPIAAAVARALDAAHRTGLVHGDIKPGNVLLGRDGSIKVADFGLAEVLSSLSKSRNEVFGTPGYIAPEILRGDASDERIDVFALGVLIYRCLSGMPPFFGNDVASVFEATMRGEFTPLTDVVPDAGDDLITIVHSMLDVDPAQRMLRPAAIASLLDKMAVRRKAAWKAPADLLDARVHASHMRPEHSRFQRSTVVAHGAL